MDRRKQLAAFWGAAEIIGRRKVAVMTASLAPFGLTHQQGFTVFFLGQRDGLSVKEVAAALGVTSSAATQLLEGLAGKGFVRRAPSPVDRRAIVVTLTPKARRFLVSMKRHQLDIAAQMFAPLTDREFSSLMALLTKVVAASGPPVPKRGRGALQEAR